MPSVAIAAPAFAQLTSVGDGGPGPVKAQHLTAELVTYGNTVAPGGTLQAGLVLTMEEKWHVYWLNAGDSGEPPHIKWTLPTGLTAGPMLFPPPSRLPLGPLMDFGYEETAAFPVTFTAAPEHEAWPCPHRRSRRLARLRAGLHPRQGPSWPQSHRRPRRRRRPARRSARRGPKPHPQTHPVQRLSVTVNGGSKDFVVTLKTGARETDDAEFYPYDPDLIANAAEQAIEPLPDGLRIRIPRALKTSRLLPHPASRPAQALGHRIL